MELGSALYYNNAMGIYTCFGKGSIEIRAVAINFTYTDVTKKHCCMWFKVDDKLITS